MRVNNGTRIPILFMNINHIYHRLIIIINSNHKQSILRKLNFIREKRERDIKTNDCFEKCVNIQID